MVKRFSRLLVLTRAIGRLHSHILPRTRTCLYEPVHAHLPPRESLRMLQRMNAHILARLRAVYYTGTMLLTYKAHQNQSQLVISMKPQPSCKSPPQTFTSTLAYAANYRPLSVPIGRSQSRNGSATWLFHQQNVHCVPIMLINSSSDYRASTISAETSAVGYRNTNYRPRLSIIDYARKTPLPIIDH